MKLKDLFEERQHETKAKMQRFSGNLVQSDSAWSDKKSGAYSRVKDDKNDPHMVRKYHHGPLGKYDDGEVIEDAYVIFALWLTKQNVNNPCFPRIYDIKKIKDRNDRYIYKYQIERLISATELSSDDLWSIYDRYFVRNETTKSMMDSVIKRSRDTNESKNIVRVMGRACEYFIQGKSDVIRDESLKDALNIIAKFMKDYKEKEYFLDIENAGNIMFRRGQYGYQLVITDPVA